SSLDVRDRVLIAIIADPTAPVYSFQARRPPTRMPRDSHCCNNFNGATAASFNPQNRICKKIALQRPKTGKFDYLSEPNHPAHSMALKFFTDDWIHPSFAPHSITSSARASSVGGTCVGRNPANNVATCAIQTRQFSGGAGRFFILILDNDRSIVK